ncbi:hypothetical protein EIP91_009456 [Steccherinum ochraceum]|uniref:Mitotic checkpoint regulator, MAD2B-interacting-domain-containing protein n=1 Tax=Steccherinum ochraceum TaxID=92696 RepID=A0A4R0RMP1_9APHY|nr:hypothetical protein EIP91_009456 [Steccherinum ochraceum]
MLGIEGYGSDSDNGSDAEVSVPQPTPKSASSLATKLPAPTKKSTFSLPPPSSSAGPSSSGLALPAPKKRAPKKISIGLPELLKDEVEEDRPAKKPRLEAGAGRSGLLSMLPAPKNKAPIPAPTERVLGGGKGPGLVFKTAPTRKVTVEDAEDADEEDADSKPHIAPAGNSLLEEVKEEKSSSVSFMPTHLRRGKANVSTEDRPTTVKATPKAAAPAIDFFGLGSSSAPSSSRATSSTSAPLTPAPSAIPSLPIISSAPKVEEFTPPEPTPKDAYPGYYQLPSGTWAAYDPVYYKKYYDKWTKEYNDHVRALEKGIEKGFEGAEEAAQEVNAAKEMERAKVEIQDKEEKKALTAGAGAGAAAPKMNIKGAALGGRAKTRHQLSALLTDAYANREELEERIAQGRRNRKEAGNKYGF